MTVDPMAQVGIDDAVAEALEEDLTDLEDAARLELVSLWSDLANARRYAMNGSWSMACEGLVRRIAILTRIVGPTSWRDVDPGALEDGTYRELHKSLGVEVLTEEGDEADLAVFLAGRAADRARWALEAELRRTGQPVR